MSQSQPVVIDVWSDIACPWCYVGKRRLEEAIAQTAAPVEVRYHAFILDPYAGPADGRTEADVLALKLGGKDRAVQALRHMTELAASEGLDFDFDRVVPTATAPTHRFLALVQDRYGWEAKARVVGELFAAHFTAGRDVGDEQVMQRAADAAGYGDLAPADIAAALRADSAQAGAVERDIAAAESHGARAVPFYILGNKYSAAGAQNVTTFADALRDLTEM
ncbi:DsbA family oxidoreductase [Rarobacter incanus]|uniref:Putative DsbA family dithiol-disulfide isomerase n=1 Tax=Rarobacter incanus TaxID=153494 RepID=A0A542SQ52_9MICO|nr:DsbA family oxidoreductase [Rarobacter incanus]TQK76708.1 putative DsbA family dithiol-disulfide isomerase [Rarobacter incanus]